MNRETMSYYWNEQTDVITKVDEGNGLFCVDTVTMTEQAHLIFSGQSLLFRFLVELSVGAQTVTATVYVDPILFQRRQTSLHFDKFSLLESQNCGQQDNLFASFIRKHFYVDNGVISMETVGEAIELVKVDQAGCSK